MVALIIMFIIIFFEIIVLGIIFSKISIQICKLDMLYDEINIPKLKINELEIVVIFYIFKYIKIFSIKIYKDYLKIFNIKIKFDFLKELKLVEENYKTVYSDMKILFKNREKVNLKLLKPNLYSFKLDLELGTFSQMFTTFIIPTISTYLAITLKKIVKDINSKKYSFQIFPKYFSRNILKINLNSKISFSTIKLMLFFFNLKQIIKQNKQEKSLVVIKNKIFSKIY